MKMIDTETGHEMVEVSGHDKKEYASNNGVTIGEGSVKITIPFMNKTVIFDKDDFNELKTNIEKYGKSE